MDGVRARWALAGGTALALLLTSCGGDDGGQSASTTSTTTVAPTTSSAPPATSSTPPTSGNGNGNGSGVPTPGTTFAGENIDAEHAADLQEEVDDGHEPWRLDQSSVATMFAANRFGWTDVEIALDDPHTVQVTDTATGQLISLQMRQPVREGETGIWVVDSGVWLG